jgi:hypothetical protein
LLLGGTLAYTRFANSVLHEAAEYTTEFSDKNFSIEVRRTFVAAAATEYSLKILFKGKPLLLRTDEILPSEDITLAKIPDVEIGDNEVFVKANMKQPFPSFAALNIRIKENGITISESTFTSVTGSSLLYGVVVFHVRSEREDAHAH